MPCYCEERKNNPGLAEIMKDIPEGYCGICDVCGKPGHTKAHPSLPFSGAWCDEHWDQIVNGQKITPDRILFVILASAAVIGLIASIFRIF